MGKKLAETVVLVTGASRGIGRAISIALGAEGATVVIAARSIEKLKETSEMVKEVGGKAEIVTVELTDERSIKDLVKGVEEKFSRLDILINNAGITHSAKIEDTTTADWDRCFSVNARGPFILCREVLRLLRKSAAGTIINISSVVGVKGYALQSAYSASKHAVRGMSIVLANELADSNIRVHVLCPGGADTEMVTQVRPDINKDELIKPTEIAELVLYLVTHRGNAVIDQLNIRRATSSPWF